MTRRVFQREAARADLRQAVDWLSDRSPSAARRLLQAYNQALLQLVEFPAMGRRYLPKQPARRELRYIALPSFRNYLIFYCHESDRVDIVRFLHAARDIDAMAWDELDL